MNAKKFNEKIGIPEPMSIELVECGSCGAYHPADFHGDCRDDNNRFPTAGPIEVYDDGYKSIDCYTVIIGESVYGMSGEPFHPQGFNQYAGEVANLPNCRNCGKLLKWKDVPDKIKQAIEERAQ